jgi:mRNA interferase RelE/StbE
MKRTAAKERLRSVYRLTYKKSVTKELDAVPDHDFLKIDEAILSLKDQPFPHPQSKKLKGEDRYRLRIGDYRVVYMVDEKQKTVTIYRVRHRKDVYR